MVNPTLTPEALLGARIETTIGKRQGSGQRFGASDIGSPTAGDGGVQCGFRREVGGAMKGPVAPSSSSSMQKFENEDEDEDENDAASLLLDPTALAQPGQSPHWSENPNAQRSTRNAQRSS